MDKAREKRKVEEEKKKAGGEKKKADKAKKKARHERFLRKDAEESLRVVTAEAEALRRRMGEMSSRYV